MQFGGYSWQKAGKIWWDTLRSDLLEPDCTFLDFAKATVAVAKKTMDENAAAVVANAWRDVGVIPSKGEREGEGTGLMDRVMGSVDRVMGSCSPS